MTSDALPPKRPPIRATKLQQGMVVAAALPLPVILVGLVAWNGGVANFEKFASGVSRLAMTYLVIVVVSWLVYLAARRRSLWPGVAMFVILMTLFSASVGFGMYRGFQRAAAVRERAAQNAQLDTVTSELQGIKRSMRETLGSDGAMKDPQAWMKAGQDGVKKMDQLSAGLTGDAAVAAKATVNLAKEISALQEAYLKQVEAYHEDGALDASTLKTREMVVRRRELLREAIDRHKKVVEFLRTQDQTLFSTCVEMGMSEKAAANVRSGAASAMARSPVVKIQNLEAEALALQDKYLETLESRWGHWSISGDSIEFDESVDTKEMAAFNAALERVAAIDNEQQALQKALLDPQPKKSE